MLPTDKWTLRVNKVSEESILTEKKIPNKINGNKIAYTCTPTTQLSGTIKTHVHNFVSSVVEEKIK